MAADTSSTVDNFTPDPEPTPSALETVDELQDWADENRATLAAARTFGGQDSHEPQTR